MGFWDDAGSWWGKTLSGKVDRADSAPINSVSNRDDELYNAWINKVQGYGDRQAPQINAGLFQDNAPQVGTAAFQNTPNIDLQLFKSAAEGNQPSAAQLQLQQGQEQAVKNQMAMLASMRGGYNPGAARMAIAQGVEANNAVNQQAATLRAQEMAAARSQFLQGLQSNQGATLAGRSQLLNAMQGNQQASMQGRSQFLNALQGNQQSYLQNQGQNDAAQMNLRQLILGTQQNKLAGAQTLYTGQAAANQAEAANRGQIVGGVLSAGGALGGKLLSGGGGTAPAGTAKPGASSQQAGEPMPVDDGTRVAAHGGYIPGKAKVSGDSLQNDTVPAKLSPGELVVPRTVVAQGPQAVAQFAASAGPAAQMSMVQRYAHGGMVPSAHFGHVLQALTTAHEKIGALEARKGRK